MASQFLRNTLQLVRPVVAGQCRRNYGAAAAAAATRSHSSADVAVRPPKKVESSKHYLPGDFPNEQSLRISFPDHIHKEMSAYVRKVAKSKPNIDTMTVDTSQIPETQAFLKKIENDHILNGTGFVILPPIKGLESIPEMRLATFFMTACCGDPLVQNAEGNKGVLVYDRDSSRLMRDGQRYHQSHEGGSLHTDNVNVPDVWESMFLTCLYPAFLGGESIVVSATAVHNFLVEVAPEAIETLQRDYFFEYRGFSNKFYKAPILFYNSRGEPCFRYLRDYMESAHKRLNTPLTQQQLLAIDLIDACNELSKFQIRTSFAKGETLWCNDVQTFHGRTRFVDSGKAGLNYDLEKPQNRLYQRTWVKSDHKEFRGLNQSRYENIDA